MDAPTFTNPVYCYRVEEVLKVVDGDTCDVMLDVGFGICVRKRLRFLGIDTWEVRGEEREQGLVAKDRLIEILNNADSIYVQTEMDAEGKYGRVLAWLWVQNGATVTNVNEQLLLEGHGEVYPD